MLNTTLMNHQRDMKVHKKCAIKNVKLWTTEKHTTIASYKFKLYCMYKISLLEDDFLKYCELS